MRGNLEDYFIHTRKPVRRWDLRSARVYVPHRRQAGQRAPAVPALADECVHTENRKSY